MSKETSRQVAKIAGKILAAADTKKKVSFTEKELRTLAASALAQRESDFDWPTWKQLGPLNRQKLQIRWNITDVAYRDTRAMAMRVGKALAKKVSGAGPHHIHD